MAKMLTVVALLVSAAGIGVLWAAGIVFPFYPPPGMLIGVAGALFVLLARWRWGPAVGSAVALFFLVGFLASPTGIDNITGNAGAGAMLGSVIQMLGVLTALGAGLVATRQSYRGSPVTR